MSHFYRRHLRLSGQNKIAEIISKMSLNCNSYIKSDIEHNLEERYRSSLFRKSESLVCNSRTLVYVVISCIHFHKRKRELIKCISIYMSYKSSVINNYNNRNRELFTENKYFFGKNVPKIGPLAFKTQCREGDNTSIFQILRELTDEVTHNR